MRLQDLMTQLTAALGAAGTGTTDNDQGVALQGWAEKHLPEVFESAKALVTGGVPTFAELGDFVGDVVQAAQELKDAFSGLQRAEIVRASITVVLRALPLEALGALGLLLEGVVLPRLIEYAFQAIFKKEEAAPKINVKKKELEGLHLE